MAMQRAWSEALRKSEEEIHKEGLRAAQTNWRWLVSYNANLARIGQQLLDYNAIQKKLSLLQREERQDEYLLRKVDQQYPWYWSAGVLAALFGLSVCILNYRVKSLDRLK